ncbi:MAG: hypothetical protein HRU36_01160 [Rickettsiales bacterium]|nr:hypothetical protein [Rickettsiales bacterium]
MDQNIIAEELSLEEISEQIKEVRIKIDTIETKRNEIKEEREKLEDILIIKGERTQQITIEDIQECKETSENTIKEYDAKIEQLEQKALNIQSQLYINSPSIVKSKQELTQLGIIIPPYCNLVCWNNVITVASTPGETIKKLIKLLTSFESTLNELTAARNAKLLELEKFDKKLEEELLAQQELSLVLETAKINKQLEDLFDGDISIESIFGDEKDSTKSEVVSSDTSEQEQEVTGETTTYVNYEYHN